MPMPNVATMAVALVASRHGKSRRSRGSDERSRKRTRTSCRCAYDKQLLCHRHNLVECCHYAVFKVQEKDCLYLFAQNDRQKGPDQNVMRSKISERKGKYSSREKNTRMPHCAERRSLVRASAWKKEWGGRQGQPEGSKGEVRPSEELRHALPSAAGLILENTTASPAREGVKRPIIDLRYR